MDRRLYPAADPAFDRGDPITLEFAGATYRAFTGEPVAVALFASGARVLSRSIKYHRPRGFFCLAGHCNGCLMRVDGVPNVRSCMAPCRDGLEIEGQNAFPASDLDMLAAVDWLFRKGMDHHSLMTRSQVLNSVMQKLVRQLSGLGRPPQRIADEVPPVRRRAVDVVVVGAGPAGLAAAEAAAALGAHVLCIDEHDAPGGGLLSHPGHGPAEASRRAGQTRAAGAELAANATALSWFPEDDGGLLAVATPQGLWRVTARRYIYATGGYDANALFENNDRPGIFAARAVGRLLVRHRVAPGSHVVVLGGGSYARSLTDALRGVAIEATAIDGAQERIVSARGHAWVDAVDVVSDRGHSRRIFCDAVAVAALPAPASEAPRQHGAKVELRESGGGFVVLVDEEGRTNVPTVFACGDVCGYMGPDEATRSGARAGAAAAREAQA